MIDLRALSLALVVLAVPAAARAECRASPSGAYSYDTREGLRGRVCNMIVEVHAGASCEGEPQWTVQRSCGQTRRLAITDHGRLISILAPAGGHRDWNIALVITRDRPDVWLRLGELPMIEHFRGPVALTFESGQLRLRAADTTTLVSFDAIEAVADRRLATTAPSSGSP